MNFLGHPSGPILNCLRPLGRVFGIVTVHGMACFLERLGGNPSFFPDLAKGETAATEVKRRWNAEGALRT
jgi:hypothetical protein